MTPDVVTVAPPGATLINFQLCEIHEHELYIALQMRGMEKYITLDEEQRKLLAELGQSDPITLSHVQLAIGSMQAFGVDHVKACNSCPVCAYHSVITLVADAMALQFTKGH
jgi:hypothetical protein